MLFRKKDKGNSAKRLQSPTPQNAPAAPGLERIAITGIGLVSPLGLTAWDSILAIHAFEARFSPHKTVMVDGNEEGTELRGATVSRVNGLDPWLDGAQRALALMIPAVKECAAEMPKKLPRALRCEIDSLLTPDDPEFYTGLKKEFPGLPFRIPHEGDKTATEMPRCAFFEKIIRAAEDLRKKKAEMALVGCVDSNVAVSRLKKLMVADRLNSASNREGIIAGEAAGAVLLETEAHARRRGAPIYGYLASWGRAEETKELTVKSPIVGHGLSDAFFEALAAFEDKGKSINRVVMDVNGERHRAYEWAINEARVFTHPGSEASLAIPLFYTGDCGGAAGAVVIMEAIGCLMLDEDAPERIALGTSDEAGARRVICLEKEKWQEASAKSPQDFPQEIIARNEFFATLREKYKQQTRRN